jgi:hypothetical protein
MSNLPNLRPFITFQAFLFTGYGLILKNLEDTLGDKLFYTGIAILTLLAIHASYRLIHKNPQTGESNN